MGHLIRVCIRCGVMSQLDARGFAQLDSLNAEVFFACNACGRGSIYLGQPSQNPMQQSGALDISQHYRADPVVVFPHDRVLSSHIPDRLLDLFKQAARCRQLLMHDAAGAMFRKTIDVATIDIFSTDIRLAGKNPANAARARVIALGQMKVLDEDIVELADVALMDGNDAAHDVDPYSADEAEALEELTADLLDRMYVRPARVAAVKAKQILSGQRKP